MKPTCQTCGREIERPYGISTANYRRRQWCDMECRRNQPSAELGSNKRAKSETLGRDEEVEWLLSFGESPYRIAERLGLRPDSLGRWLFRHGRRDLALEFFRVARAERRRVASTEKTAA